MSFVNNPSAFRHRHRYHVILTAFIAKIVHDGHGDFFYDDVVQVRHVKLFFVEFLINKFTKIIVLQTVISKL